MVQHYKPTYEFGAFLLDTKEGLLLKNGQPVTLTAKAFDTLVVLVQNSGHVLLKDELMKAVWPDRFVEEVNLAHNISVLRKALGEGEQGNRFIETVPRRGYRFIVPVRQRTHDETFTLLEERTRSTMLVEEDVPVAHGVRRQVSEDRANDGAAGDGTFRRLSSRLKGRRHERALAPQRGEGRYQPDARSDADQAERLTATESR